MAFFDCQAPLNPALIQRVDGIRAETVRAILRETAADSFVCANDRTAGLFMHCVLDMGFRIPEDIRIVGIDDVEYASLLPVPLSTVRQPCRAIGEAAMSAMLERIQNPQRITRDIFLACELIVRRSS